MLNVKCDSVSTAGEETCRVKFGVENQPDDPLSICSMKRERGCMDVEPGFWRETIAPEKSVDKRWSVFVGSAKQEIS
jgi:hypothetical protein